MNAEDDNRSLEGMVSATHGPDTRVVAPTPAPITYEDLTRYLRAAYSPEKAAQLEAGLSPEIGQPFAFWTNDILMGIAQLSPAHESRILTYLGWTHERMVDEIAKVKAT